MLVEPQTITLALGERGGIVSPIHPHCQGLPNANPPNGILPGAGNRATGFFWVQKVLAGNPTSCLTMTRRR